MAAQLSYPEDGYKCNATEHRFRTHDGHCNNLNLTGMGMAGHPFGRSALNDSSSPRSPGFWEPDPYLCAQNPDAKPYPRNPNPNFKPDPNTYL